MPQKLATVAPVVSRLTPLEAALDALGNELDGCRRDSVEIEVRFAQLTTEAEEFQTCCWIVQEIRTSVLDAINSVRFLERRIALSRKHGAQ